MLKARSIFFFADNPTVETKKAGHHEVSGLFCLGPWVVGKKTTCFQYGSVIVFC